MNRSDILNGAKPIIFSTPMVQAILEGKKTQTRRVVKPQPHDMPDGAYIDPYNKNYEHFTVWTADNRMCLGCGGSIRGAAHWKPRYLPGDILWVRETWMPCATIDSLMSDTDLYTYKADWTDISLEMQKNGVMGKYAKWRPSIHMPRAAARIFLRVTDVRAERVQEISTTDAIAEGFEGSPCDHSSGRYACEDCMNTGWREPPQVDFMFYWDSKNAKRGYGWDMNPWVWVYMFERLDQAQGQ